MRVRAGFKAHKQIKFASPWLHLHRLHFLAKKVKEDRAQWWGAHLPYVGLEPEGG